MIQVHAKVELVTKVVACQIFLKAVPRVALVAPLVAVSCLVLIAVHVVVGRRRRCRRGARRRAGGIPRVAATGCARKAAAVPVL